MFGWENFGELMDNRQICQYGIATILAGTPALMQLKHVVTHV